MFSLMMDGKLNVHRKIGVTISPQKVGAPENTAITISHDLRQHIP